jgi:hypothetical protein
VYHIFQTVWIFPLWLVFLVCFMKKHSSEVKYVYSISLTDMGKELTLEYGCCFMFCAPPFPLCSKKNDIHRKQICWISFQTKHLLVESYPVCVFVIFKRHVICEHHYTEIPPFYVVKQFRLVTTAAISHFHFFTL